MARRKMWTLLGHSIGEGFAGSSPMLVAAPWLKDYFTNYNIAAVTPADVRYSPGIQRSVYKNLFAWTAKLGCSGTGGTPPSYTPGEGTFKELTIRGVVTPGSAHPYDSPYRYPNTRTMPGSPTVYNATTTGGGTWVGVELPLSWRLSHYWMEPVYLQKLAIPSTLMMRLDAGFTSIVGGEIFGVPFSPFGGYAGYDSSYFSWFTPADLFDWDPSTNRLYAIWKARMTAAAAEAVAAGDQLDVRLVVLWLGDNDATLASTGTSYATTFGTSRAKNFGDFYKAFIDKVRQDLVDNDWTSLPKEQIRVVGMGLFRTYGSAVINSAMNSAISGLEADDDFFRFVSTYNTETLASAGYTDATLGTGTHPSHNAYLGLADDIYDAFLEMETAGQDVLASEMRVTLSEVIDEIRLTYERNRVRTDATDEIIMQHANGALFHIINSVGDQAWWLRRIHQISLTGGQTSTSPLPKVVHRVLRVERSIDIGYPLHFDFVGFDDGGRQQIILRDALQGTYNVHFITQPKKMTKTEQYVPLPYNLIEWLVIEAARRLARGSGNQMLLESLTAEATQLMNDCTRSIHAQRRPADDRLAGQRRLAGRNSYIRRRWGYYWGY